jgi:3,4-dihydroxy 2-butanone 4-phosphate synthase / GTP cyclohydrolase II
MAFAPIPDVIAALRRGEMIVLADDEDRENEGDLVMAAEFADAKSIAFMATKGCGLICLAMEGAMLDRLGLPMMTSANASRFGTAFTLSIEAREGVTTGISAADRARTVQVAIADDARPQDIVTPGHVFPLRALAGGVLVRAGHTEAAVDLARLAGSKAAGVICEIMRPDGEMARLPDLEVYAKEHGLLLGSIADLISWREARESLVQVAAETVVETASGPFRAYAYVNTLNGEHHLALVRGDALRPLGECADPVLVRVQKEALFTDLFNAGGRLGPSAFLQRIAESGAGVLLLVNDFANRSLPKQLLDAGGTQPVERRATATPAVAGMDLREYGIGAQILHHLGVRQMRLITGSDRNISALSGHGLEVVERVKP